MHVRLTEQEFAALDLLGRALLGEGHALMVAAQRFVRAGLLGTVLDEQGRAGK